MPRWLKAFLMPAVLLGGPALFVPGPFNDWRIWLFFLLAAVLVGSQPNLKYATLGREQATSEDRSTLLILQVCAYGIFATSYGAYLWERHRFGPLPAMSSLSIVGAVVAIGGMALRLIAIRTLGQWFTAAVTVQDSQKLIQHGVYRWIRHPSYTGAVLFWAALPFLLSVPLCAIVAWPLLAFAYSRRISAEEAALTKRFGDDYEEYRRRSWRLFPPVY
ncbi:MAG: isoprenylcysteine carboxylmethyltransferase family protein [Pseudomonadota bacterium]